MPSGITQLPKRQLELGHADTLIPVPEDPPGNQVIVGGGNYLNDKTLQLEFLATQASPSFSPVTAGQERWDLVYVDISNVIQKSVGTPQALGGGTFVGAPTPPEWAIPLAYVHVTETGTVVVDVGDITDLRPFLRQPYHRDLTGQVATFHDTPQMEHNKAVPSDWNSPTTPQAVDILLDELAERATDMDFLTLTDTPVSYGGEALKLVRVNAGETALEFLAAPAFTATRINRFTRKGTVLADGFTSPNTVSLVWTAPENPDGIPPEHIRMVLRVPRTPDADFSIYIIELDREWDASLSEFQYITSSSRLAADGPGGGVFWDEVLTTVDAAFPDSVAVPVASGNWTVLFGSVPNPNLRFRWIDTTRTLDVEVNRATGGTPYATVKVAVTAYVEQLF